MFFIGLANEVESSSGMMLDTMRVINSRINLGELFRMLRIIRISLIRMFIHMSMSRIRVSLIIVI